MNPSERLSKLVYKIHCRNRVGAGRFEQWDVFSKWCLYEHVIVVARNCLSCCTQTRDVSRPITLIIVQMMFIVSMNAQALKALDTAKRYVAVMPESAAGHGCLAEAMAMVGAKEQAVAAYTVVCSIVISPFYDTCTLSWLYVALI